MVAGSVFAALYVIVMIEIIFYKSFMLYNGDFRIMEFALPPVRYSLFANSPLCGIVWVRVR